MRSASPVGIDLVEVGSAEKQILWRLLQLYLHDMSEFDGSDIADGGDYEYSYFEHYFDPSLDVLDRGRWACLFRVDARLAGFAMVRHMQNGRYSMAEFFVLRKWRRTGVGSAAAAAVLHRFPGGWDLTVLPENTGARAFWRRVIEANSRGQFSEKHSSLVTWFQFDV